MYVHKDVAFYDYVFVFMYFVCVFFPPSRLTRYTPYLTVQETRQWSPQSIRDGLLEVVGIRSSLQVYIDTYSVASFS